MFFPKPWTSKSKSDQRICNFKSSAGFCCWLNRPSNWQTGPHHPTPSLPGWGVWLAFLNTWFIWLIRRERISTKTLLRRIPVLRWSRGREYPARCTFQTGEVSPNQQQPDEITDLQYIFCVQIPNWRIKMRFYRARIADTRTCDIIVYLWRILEDGDWQLPWRLEWMVLLMDQQISRNKESSWSCCNESKFISGGLNHFLEWKTPTECSPLYIWRRFPFWLYNIFQLGFWTTN